MSFDGLRRLSQPKTPVVLISGIDEVAMMAASLSVQLGLPGAVAVRHTIDSENGMLIRTVSDLTGVLECEQINLDHACVSCAIREDIVPTLERLAATQRWSGIIACLPATAEAVQVCRILGWAPGNAPHIRIAAVLTALEGSTVAEDLLGDAEVRTAAGGFAGAMQTFDNTRPLVAAMALGLTRACLDLTRELVADEGVEIDWDRPGAVQSAAAARLLQLEADYASARLLTLRAAWMADNGIPNSMEASMAKAKAGRTCVTVALACVELCGATGYAERELLEKWARDAKILDIFEGTQQIQLLVVARRLLGLTSAQLI